MYFSQHVFIFLIIWNFASGFERFLSSTYGDVGKGNFTYYSMSYDGTILIELVSVTGDCDLYVSQITNKPTYEPEFYCLQSATCGLDSVIVPKKFIRPVGIGIFGHPSHDVSSYQLSFFKIADSCDIFNYDPGSKSFQNLKNERSQENINSNPVEEEESFLWVFLRSLVMFLIECIL